VTCEKQTQSSKEHAVSYTYYDYLDITPDASPALIESAFLGLLERYDYGASDTGQDLRGLIAMVHTAYRVLSCPEERNRYDATLAREAAMADAELKATLDRHDFAGRLRWWVGRDAFDDATSALAA
jgi:DnaJ-class molecular chaperone